MAHHLQQKTSIDGFYVLFEYGNLQENCSINDNCNYDFDSSYQSNVNSGQFDISQIPTCTVLIRNLDILKGESDVLRILSGDKFPSKLYSAKDCFSRQFLGFVFAEYDTIDCAAKVIQYLQNFQCNLQVDFGNSIQLKESFYWDRTIVLENQIYDCTMEDFYEELDRI